MLRKPTSALKRCDTAPLRRRVRAPRAGEELETNAECLDF